jgi:phosphate transport system permease protein
MTTTPTDQQPKAQDAPRDGHESLLSRTGNALRRQRRDRITGVVLLLLMGLAAIPLALILIEVVRQGAAVISWEFFTEAENPPAREGGGYAAGFVGTGLIMFMAIGISVPLGLAAAVYLVEFGKGPFATVVRFVTDVMTGIPSVFIGLAIYALLIIGTGQFIGFGAFTGAVAIAIVMLPIIVRSCEEVLKTVSADMRRGALALGARRWQTTTRVVLPAAAPGLTTGIMLAVARGAGETAPLILTAFGNVNIVYALYNTAIGAVPLQIYDGARQPFDPGIDRAWGGALSLLTIILVLTVVARLIGSRGSKGQRV